MNDALKVVVEKYHGVPDFTGVNISDLDTRSISGDQLLHVAVVNGDKASVEVLLSEGALVNSKGENGFTPLHYAVEKGCYDIVELLLSHGADKTIVNKFSETPLDLAHNLDNLKALDSLGRHCMG